MGGCGKSTLEPPTTTAEAEPAGVVKTRPQPGLIEGDFGGRTVRETLERESKIITSEAAV